MTSIVVPASAGAREAFSNTGRFDQRRTPDFEGVDRRVSPCRPDD